MAAETQYTANTGIGVLTTANANLDGSTGAYVTVLTAASSGTFVKTVTIKARGNTTHGIVRLFVYDGVTTRLIREVDIPAQTISSTDPAFETSIVLNLHLEVNAILKASTQNSETFSVIAEGLDWAYYTTSVRPESANYSASNCTMVTISTANSNLDGTTGAYDTIFTAGGGNKGSLISNLIIKAQVSTTPGMIRLFLTIPGSTTNILKEIPVPAITKSATASSFYYRLNFEGRGFSLKPGWILKATTENAESFNIHAEVLEWTHPA